MIGTTLVIAWVLGFGCCWALVYVGAHPEPADYPACREAAKRRLERER